MGIFSRKNKTNHKGGGHLSEYLRDEKQKANIILDGIDDAVILIDAQNHIQVFNPSAAKITGWQPEEALGLDYRAIIKLTDEKGREYTDAKHPFYRVFQENDIVRDTSASISNKQDHHMSVDISVSPLLDGNGHINGAVGVLRDVNEQRKQEKQRADFISTASHEMRTPVAAIEGYLALSLNEKVCQVDLKARDYLEKAQESTRHLGQLFQDLLTSAKAEDGRLTSHPTPVEIGEFVEKLVEDLRFSAEKKGLGLEFLSTRGSQTMRPLLYALVDADRLREVITNLFDNAVKYTESGKISIGITGDANVVQFNISDTGPGIPKEDIVHLFQKFYRVDNSATRTIGGTGLGLFICKKIVELYKGRVWVESVEGQGSTFYINLPRIKQEQVAGLQAQASQTNEPLQGQSL